MQGEPDICILCIYKCLKVKCEIESVFLWERHLAKSTSHSNRDKSFLVLDDAAGGPQSGELSSICLSSTASPKF